MQIGGFIEWWCFTSVNYSVMVNMDKVGPIYPERGLRQEDSLSSYLFTLVAEGLSTLINKAVIRGDIMGSRYVEGYLKYPIYFLLTTVFCFVGPIFLKWTISWIYFVSMEMHRVRKLIYRSQKYFSAVILVVHPKKILLALWEFAMC